MAESNKNIDRLNLILHIGAPKTATSFLQRFFESNRQLLLEQGILYPDDISGPAQHDLVDYCFSKPRAEPQPYVPKFLSRFNVNYLKSQIYKAEPNTVLISSERLSAWRDTMGFDFDRFLSFFTDFGVTRSNIKVLYFIRRPDSYFESRYNQNVKAGNLDMRTDSIQWFTSKKEDELSGIMTLKFWENFVGREAINVIPFESRQFPEGIEKRFIIEIGAQWDSRYVIPERENEKLTRAALDYAGAFVLGLKKRKVPLVFKRLQGYVMRRCLEDYSHKHPDTPEEQFFLSPAERRQLIDTQRENLDWIQSRYMGNSEPGLFSSGLPNPDDHWIPYDGMSEREKEQIEAYRANWKIPMGSILKIKKSTIGKKFRCLTHPWVRKR